jgi:hypothetical protein
MTIKIAFINITLQWVPTFLVTKNVTKGDMKTIMRAVSVSCHKSQPFGSNTSIQRNCVKFEVLTAVLLKIQDGWD